LLEAIPQRALQQFREFHSSKKGPVLMMSFKEWIEFHNKQKKKESKNERSTSQASSTSGNVDHEGQAAGDDQKKSSQAIQLFPER
jgi:hypothetical protein